MSTKKNVLAILFLVSAFVFGVISISIGINLGKGLSGSGSTPFTVEIIFGAVIALISGIGIYVINTSEYKDKATSVFLGIVSLLILSLLLIMNALLAKNHYGSGNKPSEYTWSIVLWILSGLFYFITFFGEPNEKTVVCGIAGSILQVIVIAINYNLLVETSYLFYLLTVIIGAGAYLTLYED